MGRSRRDHPKHLASKLLQIRNALNLTQEQMAEKLRKIKPSIRPGHVSEFERELREPSLQLLLCYARMAGVYVDVLIDDELDMPKRLPVKQRSK